MGDCRALRGDTIIIVSAFIESAHIRKQSWPKYGSNNFYNNNLFLNYLERNLKIEHMVLIALESVTIISSYEQVENGPDATTAQKTADAAVFVSTQQVRLKTKIHKTLNTTTLRGGYEKIHICIGFQP